MEGINGIPKTLRMYYKRGSSHRKGHSTKLNQSKKSLLNDSFKPQKIEESGKYCEGF